MEPSVNEIQAEWVAVSAVHEQVESVDETGCKKVSSVVNHTYLCVLWG